jgi:hypothetical protein
VVRAPDAASGAIPVKPAVKLVDWAKGQEASKLDFHPYGGAPRAFTVNPAP